MANIFKTTLKKDVISDIVNNKMRKIRFPITKFWSSRLTNEYNLNKKTFVFKTFDTLELSSPSNKDTASELYVFDFVKTFVDDNEFVIEFKDSVKEVVETCEIEEENIIVLENENVAEKDTDVDELSGDSDIEEDNETELLYIDNNDVFESIKQWFDNNMFLETLYENEDVIATNARQIIVHPNGKILGINKTLPVNNDVAVRIEFDMNERVYFDPSCDFDVFEDGIFRTLVEIRKNNFVFIWKRYTGIFMDNEGRIYFGIKYSTRKSIGFNRKYNVQ